MLTKVRIPRHGSVTPGEALAGAGLRAAQLRLQGLTTAAKLIYGTGQVVDEIPTSAVLTFLFFYLTAVCGLTGTQAGLSFFVALAVDAFVDPMVGSISDNSRSRWGRRHLFLILSAAPIGVALAMLFSLPHLSGWALCAYVTVVALVMRIGLSFYNVPYIALGAELTDRYTERSVIVAYRSLYSSIGRLLPILFGFSVYFREQNGLLRRPTYIWFGWTCAIALMLGGWVTAFGTLRIRNRMHPPVARANLFWHRFAPEVGEVFHSQSFRIIFCTMLIFFTSLGMGSTLLLHAIRFFWQLPENVIQWVTLAGPVGLALGIPVMGALSRRLEKKILSIGAVAIFAAIQVFLPILRIFHALPRTGFALYAVLICGQLIQSACFTGIVIAFQSMMADAADEHELTYGARREGLFFSGLSFSAKAAAGLGGLLSGLALDAIRFPTDIAADPHMLVNAIVARNLGLVAGPGAALGMVACALILLRYRLNRNRFIEIQEELFLRRSRAANASPRTGPSDSMS